MPNNEIPPAEQSVAKMIDIQHQIAESHTPPGTSIGEIISPPPNIKIAWNNIIIDKKRIYIDEYLLKGHERKAEGRIKSSTQLIEPHKHVYYNDDGIPSLTEEAGEHLHDIDDPYTESLIMADTLKIGDLVEVTPLKGEQLFIVKCKLVYLGKTEDEENG